MKNGVARTEGGKKKAESRSADVSFRISDFGFWFSDFISTDGCNRERVTNPHARARMLAVKNPLDRFQHCIGKGQRDRSFDERQRSLLIQPAVFRLELRKRGVITRVSLRAAENKFTADVSTGKQRQVSPACQRFALRNTGTPELFHHDGEFASVVPERYRC